METPAPTTPVQPQYNQPATPTPPQKSSKGKWIGGIAVLGVTGVGLWLLLPGTTSDLAESIPGGVTLSVVPSTTEITVGTQLVVEVRMDGGQYSVTGADVAVSYDPALLRATAIKPGPFLATQLRAGEVTDGRATITLGSGTDPARGSGVVAVVTFQTLARGSATITLSQGTQVAASGSTGSVLGRTTAAIVTLK